MFIGSKTFPGQTTFPGICWGQITERLKICTIFCHAKTPIGFEETVPVSEYLHNPVIKSFTRSPVIQGISHDKVVTDIKEVKPLQEIARPEINLSFPRSIVVIKFDRVRKCR